MFASLQNLLWDGLPLPQSRRCLSLGTWWLPESWVGLTAGTARGESPEFTGHCCFMALALVSAHALSSGCLGFAECVPLIPVTCWSPEFMVQTLTQCPEHFHTHGCCPQGLSSLLPLFQNHQINLPWPAGGSFPAHLSWLWCWLASETAGFSPPEVFKVPSKAAPRSSHRYHMEIIKVLKEEQLSSRGRGESPLRSRITLYCCCIRGARQHKAGTGVSGH